MRSITGSSPKSSVLLLRSVVQQCLCVEVLAGFQLAQFLRDEMDLHSSRFSTKAISVSMGCVTPSVPTCNEI